MKTLTILTVLLFSTVAIAQDKQDPQESIIDQLLRPAKKKPINDDVHICNMSIHKRLIVSRNIEIMRVYGGWIYYRHNMGSVFVPENGVCQSIEKEKK